jgi:hypothetical protein
MEYYSATTFAMKKIVTNCLLIVLAGGADDLDLGALLTTAFRSTPDR